MLQQQLQSRLQAEPPVSPTPSLQSSLDIPCGQISLINRLEDSLITSSEVRKDFCWRDTNNPCPAFRIFAKLNLEEYNRVCVEIETKLEAAKKESRERLIEHFNGAELRRQNSSLNLPNQPVLFQDYHISKERSLHVRLIILTPIII